jgi:hypothetical protein
MNLLAFIIMTILTPIVSPILQHGAQRLQARLQVQQTAPQVAQPQPYVVYHEGRWWKFENNQWYVWR